MPLGQVYWIDYVLFSNNRNRPKAATHRGSFGPKAFILFLAYRFLASQLLVPHKLELTDHIFLSTADFKLGGSYCLTTDPENKKCSNSRN